MDGKGDMRLLQKLIELGCPWHANAMQAAHLGEEANLAMLRWAFDHGCPMAPELALRASEENNLELLQWAHRNGARLNAEITKSAAWNGNLPMLRYAVQNACPWHQETILTAIIAMGDTDERYGVSLEDASNLIRV